MALDNAGQQSPISPSRNYHREDDAIDIGWIVATVLRWKRAILGSTVLSGLLALVYLSLATPSYVATAQLLIESRKPKIITGTDVAPGLNTNRFMIGQVIESQIELLRSPRIAERVIRQLQMQDRQPESAKPGSLDGASGVHETKSDIQTGQVPDSLTIPQAEIDVFLSRLDVRRVGLSLIIQVSFFHEDPKKAATIATAVATAYLEGQEEARANKSKNVSEWLGNRVEDLRKAIRTSQQKIESYRAENDLIDAGGQLLRERELSETMAQSIAARANSSAVLVYLRQMEKSASPGDLADSTGLTLKSNVIANYKQQYAQVNRRLATAISRYGSKHPQVENFRAELSNLQHEIRQEAARLVQNQRHEYEIAKARAQLLEERVKELKKNLHDGRTLKIELSEMQRDLRVNNDLHATLLSRLREIQLRTSLKQPDTQIVRFAKPPQRPSRPRKLLTLAGGLLAGLGLSICFALLHEFSSNILRSPEGVSRYLGIERVVTLPLLAAGRGNSKDLNVRTRVAKHARTNDGSRYVQNIFVLTQIVKKNRSPGIGQVIAFISQSNGEGKTSTAINLADYVADSGLRVLLLDCDMHECGATQILSPNAELSMRDLLLGAKSLEDVLVRDPETSVAFCPAVTMEGTRPMDLLASEQFSAFLTKARVQFDLVILDTPPLDAFVDARALASEADLLVLIVEANRARVAGVEAALQPISEHRGKIRAVALNKYT